MFLLDRLSVTQLTAITKYSKTRTLKRFLFSFVTSTRVYRQRLVEFCKNV